MGNPFAAPAQTPAQSAPVAATPAPANPYANVPSASMNPAATVAPQYAPAQYVAQAPGAPAQQYGADPFANSDPAPQAPRGPRFRELYGRLVIIIPKGVEKGVVSTKFKNTDGSPTVQDRMTADIIVLDGGTIHYGGRPEDMPPVPHDKTAEVPARWNDTFISYNGIISQCRNALADRQAGRVGLIIGRLVKGQDSGKGNPPWLLAPANEQEKAAGRQYIATMATSELFQ